jgi:hypothetical protein
MKTLQQFVRSGIRNLGELKKALQLALQLEFATIPPYLCAQWSIKNDPDRVEGVLHHVVTQEMNHMALAGNLLSAIGGTPRVAHSRFLPRYPLRSLPGGVKQELPVDLRSLSFDQLEVFMQIEYPEFPPIGALTAGPGTIGEFYDGIIQGFQTIRPKLRKGANCVPVVLSGPILTTDDAVSAVTRIKIEGEGVQDSPEQPTSEGSAHAHYYLFKEIYRQRKLIKTSGGWEFTGAQIVFPQVYKFRKRNKDISLQAEFRKSLTKLLIDLEKCWRRGDSLNVATMFRIHELGRALVQLGICPKFEWLKP